MANINGESVGELRENVPLKTGNKKSSWFKSISCSEESFGGSRTITISFAVLTVAITIALIAQIYYGDYQIIPHGSVATDFKECSAIGVDILKRGGNAIDGAIASALCLAVVNPHSTGLDAGGIFMLYSHRTRTTPLVIDFTNGPSSVLDDVPMPTLVLSLVNIHMNYGRLHWKDIVLPSAKLASQGFLVAGTLAKAIERSDVKNIFGHVQAGQNLTLIKLSNYLNQLASIPEDRLQKFLSTKHELIRNTAIKYIFNKYNIYVPNWPSGGPLLLMNLGHLSEVNFTNIDPSDSQFQLAKIMLDMYEQLNITNDNFHQGTSSNIAVIDNDDIYVSLITGMYDFFGSKLKSEDGYLLDMKDSYKNTRIPIIITDKKLTCGRRIVLGSGDLSTAIQIIFSLIVNGENVTKSVEQPRFQIINAHGIGVEEIPSKQNLDWNFFLHELESITTVTSLPEPYGSCNIVEKVGDSLSSHSDGRGDGISYRF